MENNNILNNYFNNKNQVILIVVAKYNKYLLNIKVKKHLN